MKIVITGALGHIGSRLIREIPKDFPGAGIIMIDNLLTQRYCSLFNLPAEADYHFIEADVLRTDLDSIIKDCDVVVHLAAITDAANSFKQRELVETVNFNATVRVAEACGKASCPMIYISSTSIYGAQNKIVNEECSVEELKPQSPYAETKLKEEIFLQGLGRNRKLRFVICRFGTICGISPGMRYHTAVNKFCWQAVMRQPLSVWRTALHQKRPYLSLDDAIGAIIFIIKKGLFDGRIYNILTENLTVNSIVQFIKKYVPAVKVEYVDTAIMNQLSYEVSNESIKRQGFEFTGSMENNIAETLRLLNNAGG